MALTDILTPRICELGKIKIGGLAAPKTSGQGKSYRQPRKDDYFTITSLNRERRADSLRGDLEIDRDLMDELLEKHGDKDGKLRKLPIFVLSNDIEDIIQPCYSWYAGQKCIGRSDGKTVTWFCNPKNKEPLAVPAEKPWTRELQDWRGPGGAILFKLHTTFNCIIDSTDNRWGGVYKFRTTGRISSEQLYGSLLQISQFTGGILRGIPMWLRVRPMQVSPNGQATTVYVVHCEIHGRDLIEVQSKALQIAQTEIAQAGKMKRLMLEYKRLTDARFVETADDQAEIQEEFHPEQPDKSSANGTPAAGPDTEDPLMKEAVPEKSKEEPSQEPAASDAEDTESWAPTIDDDTSGQAFPDDPDLAAQDIYDAVEQQIHLAQDQRDSIGLMHADQAIKDNKDRLGQFKVGFLENLLRQANDHLVSWNARQPARRK